MGDCHSFDFARHSILNSIAGATPTPALATKGEAEQGSIQGAVGMRPALSGAWPWIWSADFRDSRAGSAPIRRMSARSLLRQPCRPMRFLGRWRAPPPAPYIWQPAHLAICASGNLCFGQPVPATPPSQRRTPVPLSRRVRTPGHGRKPPRAHRPASPTWRTTNRHSYRAIAAALGRHLPTKPG